MSKAAKKGSKNPNVLEPALARVVSAFGKLSSKDQRRFANAVSNEMPTNPKLGNSSRQSRGADQRPATSQFGKPSPDQEDYFRQPRNRASQYNNEPDASITPARVTLSVRMRNNPIKGLTFERLVTALDQWRLGFFRTAGMAWDTMERRDYQLQICRPKRLKSVARHGYDILIRDDVDDSQKALAQSQKEFLDNFYANATATTALNPDEEGGFSLLVRQMMDAVGKYYAIHEIIWQPLPDGTLTAKFIFCPVWWFEGTRGKLRFLPSEFQIYGNEMMPGEWLVTCGDGIMEACSVVYLMKSLVLKSGLAFLDKFGMPGIHGKTDAVKDSPEWNDFVTAVQDFAQEWSAVTNRNADLSLVEAKSNGEAGFEKFINMFDRAITQLWRGADLGTTAGKNATGASLQEDESEILETDDAKMLEETLDSKVTKYALAWKFGPDAERLAYVKLRTTPRRNIQDDLAVDEFLATVKGKDGRGVLGLQALMERYSRAIPKPDEEVAEVAAPKLAGAAGTPPGKTDKNPEFANADHLDAKSQALVVEAVLSEFASINKRLATVAEITDAEVQKQKLAAILADLDKLKKNLDHDPAVANAIYKILSANLANGMAEGGDKKFANGDVPGHEFHGNQWVEAGGRMSGGDLRRRIRKETGMGNDEAKQLLEDNQVPKGDTISHKKDVVDRVQAAVEKIKSGQASIPESKAPANVAQRLFLDGKKTYGLESKPAKFTERGYIHEGVATEQFKQDWEKDSSAMRHEGWSRYTNNWGQDIMKHTVPFQNLTDSQGRAL